MNQLTFDQTIDFLENLYHRPLLPAAEVGLRRVGALLAQIGNPHRAFRSVHVAGSSGKGSTTTMIGSILQAAGFRTGYFRSPHLSCYTERISVNGRDITREEWTDHFRRILPTVERMQTNSLPDYGLGRPALFEVLFALMALHFRETGVEWAAVETGLGGRLDATNLLEADVAVVTNVSLEHTQILGKTVSAIAREKAAIIKQGSHAVTASRDADALSVIRDRAREVGAPLLEVGRDIRYQIEAKSADRISGQRLALQSGSTQLSVDLPLAGEFQAVNAATAFGAALALHARGVAIEDHHITHGLETVQMPGRFELVSEQPMIVLDGAHHPAAAHELRRAAEQLLPGRRLILLVATMSDKDVESMARELGPIADLVIVTRAPGTERAAPTARLAAAFASVTPAPTIVVEEDADSALARALQEVDAGSALLVTGSLYLIGHVRDAWLAATVAR